jgi:hypothetical protein
MTDGEIEAALAALAARRGASKTFCPSEAARALASDWRRLMPEIRRVAGDMQDRGALQAYQKGVPVDSRTARGAIRLGLPSTD